MDIVWSLRGTPERELLIGIEMRNGRVLLHGQMRVAFVEKRVFANQVGFGESFIHIAELERDFLVDVAAVAVFVNARLVIITPSSIEEIVCSGSYSTSIKFIASKATSSSMAATAATGSPMKRTLSIQSACSSWLTGRMPYGIGKSFPVTTAKTPGNASAFDTSTLLINAWGRCERRILQNNMRGSTMSSANFVCPTHFARASTLRK